MSNFLPPTGGAPTPLTFDFPYQSFFDSAKLEQALLVQNTPIVQQQQANTGGYAVMVHPSSQAPAALDFQLADAGKGGKVPGGIMIAKPGQIIRPGRFSSFNWGLPYGLLGGGQITLLVAQNEKTDFGAASNAEVIFHRTRMIVLQNNVVGATLKPNWPIRFPWPQAISAQTGGAAQGATPNIGVVNPTKVFARLRLAAVPANATMRMIFVNVDDFDRDSNYAVQASGAFGGAASVDIPWSSFAQSGISVTGGAGTLEFPFLDLDQVSNTPLVKLGGDNCAVLLVDVTADGSNPLVGAFVDFARYGVL